MLNADKLGSTLPKSAAHSKLSHLLEPGRVVHNIDGSAFRVLSKIAAGDSLVFRLANLQGQPVKTPSDFHPISGEMARFASRLRYVLAYNKDLTKIVNSMIQKHGYPIDPAMDWSKYVQTAMAPALAAVSPDFDLQDEAIYQVIVRALVDRDILADFPNAIKKFPAPVRKLPVERQISEFLKKAFVWRIKEAKAYMMQIQPREETSVEREDEQGESYSLLDTEEHATGTQDFTRSESDADFQAFRDEFYNWLYTKNKASAAGYALLLDLYWEQSKVSDNEVKLGDLTQEWLHRSGLGFDSLKAYNSKFPTMLKSFVLSHGDKLKGDYEITQLVRHLLPKQKARPAKAGAVQTEEDIHPPEGAPYCDACDRLQANCVCDDKTAGDVLEMPRQNKPEMKNQVAYRDYRCKNCGHIQPISTNHTGDVIDYCQNCSWKPSWRGDENYSKDAPNMEIPFNGRTYRPFEYVQDKTSSEKEAMLGHDFVNADGEAIRPEITPGDTGRPPHGRTQGSVKESAELEGRGGGKDDVRGAGDLWREEFYQGGGSAVKPKIGTSLKVLPCCGSVTNQHKPDCPEYNKNFDETVERLRKLGPRKDDKKQAGAKWKVTIRNSKGNQREETVSGIDYRSAERAAQKKMKDGDKVVSMTVAKQAMNAPQLSQEALNRMYRIQLEGLAQHDCTCENNDDFCPSCEARLELGAMGDKQAAEKPKCPHCGSDDYALMPTDFETAKCKDCGKNWDHGIVEGINDPYPKSAALGWVADAMPQLAQVLATQGKEALHSLLTAKVSIKEALTIGIAVEQYLLKKLNRKAAAEQEWYKYLVTGIAPEVPEGHEFWSKIPDLEAQPTEVWQKACPWRIPRHGDVTIENMGCDPEFARLQAEKGMRPKDAAGGTGVAVAPAPAPPKAEPNVEEPPPQSGGAPVAIAPSPEEAQEDEMKRKTVPPELPYAKYHMVGNEMKTADHLVTEQNTPEVEHQVEQLIATHPTTEVHERCVPVFEHGQWWVTCGACGAIWSVVDIETTAGMDSPIDLEEVESGDDSCIERLHESSKQVECAGCGKHFDSSDVEEQSHESEGKWYCGECSKEASADPYKDIKSDKAFRQHMEDKKAWTEEDDEPETEETIQDRLEYLRGELQAERISYEELAELQSLAEYIDPGDVELLEAAGVEEFFGHDKTYNPTDEEKKMLKEMGIKANKKTAFEPGANSGMRGSNDGTYIYQADVWCEQCAREIAAQLDAEGKTPADVMDEASYDSDNYPKGPFFEEESDSPEHCSGCGIFLENPLTHDGQAYMQQMVDEAIANGRADEPHIKEWMDFYNYHPEEVEASTKEATPAGDVINNLPQRGKPKSPAQLGLTPKTELDQANDHAFKGSSMEKEAITLDEMKQQDDAANEVKKSGPSSGEDKGYYVDVHYQKGGITLKPTQQLLSDVRDSGDASQDPQSRESIWELMEDFFTNGWENVNPEDIGALTSGEIFSDPNGNLYWHERYQIEDMVEELKKGEDVFMQYGGNLYDEEQAVSQPTDPNQMALPIESSEKTALDPTKSDPSYDNHPVVELLWDMLPKDPQHKDRRQTAWGTKTKQGLVLSVERAVKDGASTKPTKHATKAAQAKADAKKSA